MTQNPISVGCAEQVFGISKSIHNGNFQPHSGIPFQFPVSNGTTASFHPSIPRTASLVQHDFIPKSLLLAADRKVKISDFNDAQLLPQQFIIQKIRSACLKSYPKCRLSRSIGCVLVFVSSWITGWVPEIRHILTITLEYIIPAFCIQQWLLPPSQHAHSSTF